MDVVFFSFSILSQNTDTILRVLKEKHFDFSSVLGKSFFLLS